VIPELQTFLLAMTPLGELRLSLPLALTLYRLDLVTAFLISVIGNLVPVILILLFLGPVSKILAANSKLFERFFSWLFKRTREKHDFRIKKYGYPALALFVAIPLPVTGAWTGSLIAFLFDIPFKKAFPLIALGVIIAGGIVTFLTKTGIAVEKYFGWQVLIGCLITIGFLWLIYRLSHQVIKKSSSH